MEEKHFGQYVKPLCFGVLSGAVCITLLFIAAAVLIANVDIPVPSVSLIVCVCGGVGSFVAGFVAAKLLHRKGVIIGLACALFLGLVVFVGTLIVSGSLSSGEIITKYIVILAAGMLGGALGVTSKSRRRHR